MTWRHSAAAARGLLFSNNIILMSCSPTFFWVIKVKNTTFPTVKNEHHIANHHQSPPITHQSPPKYGANHLPITSEIDRIWPWHDSENLQQFSSDCAVSCLPSFFLLFFFVVLCHTPSFASLIHVPPFAVALFTGFLWCLDVVWALFWFVFPSLVDVETIIRSYLRFKPVPDTQLRQRLVKWITSKTVQSSR